MADTREDAIARLERDLSEARTIDEAQTYLVEHLADWGPLGIDVQALAQAAQEVEG